MNVSRRFQHPHPFLLDKFICEQQDPELIVPAQVELLICTFCPCSSFMHTLDKVLLCLHSGNFNVRITKIPSDCFVSHLLPTIKLFHLYIILERRKECNFERCQTMNI